MSMIWMQLADGSVSNGELGYAAYARKQAAVYQSFRDDVMGHWGKREEARKKLVDGKGKTRQKVSDDKSVAGELRDLEPTGNDDYHDDDDEEGWQDLENYAQGSLEDEDEE
ncbi:hypothetical protein VNI00_018801 [Paramarasmius palmivorus]|uniref:Uncharacterized protein n=1 Tax=Paramarasmius palmivorus TaxID=297713 RepID=A0AAW0AUI5_9AGAR